MEEAQKSASVPLKKAIVRKLSAGQPFATKKQQPVEEAVPAKKQAVEGASAKSSAPIVELMCRYCRKLCFSNEELEVHEKTHLDNKKLMCRLCGKGFARRSYLSEHMLIHTGVCPWQCDQCPKTFALRCNLVRHTRVHSGEKPFKCELCTKSFTLKKNMQEHRLTHTKEKPFCCPQCARKFARRSSLVRHARTHTDSRTFECAHCGKKFPWRYYLQRHLINKHEDPQKAKLPPKKRLRRTKEQIARDKAAAQEVGKKRVSKECPALIPIVPGHEIKIEEGEGTTRVFLSSSVVGDNYEFEGADSIKEEKLPTPAEEGDKSSTVAALPEFTNSGARECDNPIANEKETEGAFEIVEIKEEAIEIEETFEQNEDPFVQTRIPFKYVDQRDVHTATATSVIKFGGSHSSSKTSIAIVPIPRM